MCDGVAALSPWERIDVGWEHQLHRPLHVAGYYLNHMSYYNPEFKVDYEVKRGMYACTKRMVADIDELANIDA